MSTNRAAATTVGGTKRNRRGGDPGIPNRIAQERAAAGLSGAELAHRLGWSDAKLSKIERQGQAVTLAQLAEVASVLRVPVSRLLHPNLDFDAHVAVRPVPVVPREVLDGLRREAIARLRHDWQAETVLVACEHPNAFAARLRCHHMDKALPLEAHVLVDPDDREPKDRKVYVLRVDGDLTIRRFRAEPVPRYVGESTQTVDDIFPDASAAPPEVIGRVVRSFMEM